MAAPVDIAVGTTAICDIPPTLWPALIEILSEDERSRAERFHFERNRQEFIAAHALKRIMLSRLAGGAPADWTFTVEANGKPIVEGHGPHFNISHCDGLVACSVSEHVPVGVDVEPVDREAPLEVARDYFTDGECAWLFGLSKSNQSFGFMRLWTLKEAYLKAVGTGIADGTTHFGITFDPLGVTFTDATRTASQDWHLRQSMIGTRYLLGLAWCGLEAEVSLLSLRLEELL